MWASMAMPGEILYDPACGTGGFLTCALRHMRERYVKTPDDEQLMVIDHNQAFDPQFSEQQFVNLHAFHAQIHALVSDWVVQRHYRARFTEAMAGWREICNTVPEEWWFVDAEQTVPTNFDLEATRQLLMRCQSDDFWSMK
jgi:hypothetical protein